jgi:hypothetical protein
MVLRTDGIGCGDIAEKFTSLLFVFLLLGGGG